ncbi:MAG: hypothetical protein SchgKO_07410 [Schleiferiaceae bacterium]
MRQILRFGWMAVLFLAISPAFGQIVTTVYQEDFDGGAPYQTTSYNTDPLTTITWNDTTYLSCNGTTAMHANVVSLDTIILETDAFSTVGNPFVRLSFCQIMKEHFTNRGKIQVSNDNGATWHFLVDSMYQGYGDFSLDYFNEASYVDPAQTPYWGGLTFNPAAAVQPNNTWWANETFDISAIAGGVNGYSQVKVRFLLYKPGTFQALAGWFLDNILVEAAPCELYPPRISFGLINPKRPEGPRYQSSEEVLLYAWDEGTGINADSVVLHYDLYTGGAWSGWQDTIMTAVTGGGCKDTGTYQYFFTNLNVGDSINWYVEAFDCGCPNMTRNPDSLSNPNIYTFWIDQAPPAYCGPSLPNSFPFVVATFPHTTDFETGEFVAGSGTGDVGNAHRGTFPVNNPTSGGTQGNWTVVPITTAGSGYGWSIRTGPTATNNTGPDGNHTTGGSKYLYTEGSQGNNLANTRVNTFCYQLPVSQCMGLEFYYHMYGAHIDRLRVDIDTGDGTGNAQWITGAWIAVGQQQINSAADWEKAFVSLDGYQGKYVRIRWFGRKLNGDRSDIAIDDITVFAPPPTDVELVRVNSPENGFCAYTATDTVNVRVRSLGCSGLTEIPLAYSVSLNGGASTIARDTIVQAIASGDEFDYTFVPNINLSAYGTYDISVWAEVPGDTTNSNDTISGLTVVHENPISTFPYFMNFEVAPWMAGDNSNLNPGVFGNQPDWTPAPNMAVSGLPEFGFVVGDEYTPTANTGPLSGMGGTGNYLVTEGDYGFAPASAVYFSRCMDFTSMTNPTLGFYYHAYGTDVGALFVQVVEPGEKTWTLVPASYLAGPQQTSEKDKWDYMEVDLSQYAGEIIKARLVYQKGGTGTASDIAVDNLNVYDRQPTDVGISWIQRPGARMDIWSGSTQVGPILYFRNFGTNTVTSIPYTYEVTPLCGPNAGIPVTYTGTYNGAIAPDSEATYNVPVAPAWPEGGFDIKVYTTLASDGMHQNDTLSKRSAGWPTVNIPYFENFDNCTYSLGSFNDGGLRIFEKATNGSLGAPNSTPYAWYSGDFNSYLPNYEESLNLPALIGFDTIRGASLRFRHKYDFNTGDGGQVQFNSAQGWKRLGVPGLGINVYNTGSVPALGNEPGFAGASTGWEYTEIPMNDFDLSSGRVVLRFFIGSASGFSPGWAIDDVELYVPPQNSAAPIFAESRTYFFVPNIINDIKVKIQNTGAKPLDSCLVNYQILDASGTVVVPWTPKETFVPTNKMFAGMVSKPDYVFSEQWINPASGAYTLCVATSRPNNKQDNLTSDDTLCLPIIVLDEVDMAADSSYCNDFDDPTQNPWVAYNYINKAGLVAWAEDVVDPVLKAPFTPLAGSPKGWITKLDTNYKSRDSSALFSPVFLVDSGQVYKISFKHWIHSEQYHDGGNVSVSFDAGDTWRVIGKRYADGSVDWYNTDFVTSLDLTQPGWTGHGTGWEDASINVAFDSTGSAILRFRFASDQTVEDAGWMVDSFCFARVEEFYNDYIGIEEEEDLASANMVVGYPAPNPTSGLTELPMRLLDGGNVEIRIRNIVGQDMLYEKLNLETGEQRFTFDVSQWSPGIYMLTLDHDGHHFTRKIVVN